MIFLLLNCKIDPGLLYCLPKQQRTSQNCPSCQCNLYSPLAKPILRQWLNLRLKLLPTFFYLDFAYYVLLVGNINLKQVALWPAKIVGRKPQQWEGCGGTPAKARGSSEDAEASELYL